MTDLTLIQQTEQSLQAIKTFASQSNNEQLLDHIHRLETALGTLTAIGDTITVGDISGSTAVAIGHDINIIVNQAIPPAVKQPLENVQKQWSAAHLEVRKVQEHKGGHIFLSYSRADKEIAFQIRRELEGAGHIVWQDLTAIKGGDEWIKSIEAGVEKSYALITVVSEASQKSEWVQIEYLHAKRRGKLIVPIKVDASEIPTILLATNVVHGHPDLNVGIGQLLASLPAPPDVEESQPLDRRALELRYLDSLLLEHSVWQEVYTPMAGVGQLRTPKERKTPGVHMKTTPTTIDVGYLGCKFISIEDEELRGETETKQYEADITPAIEEMCQLVILGEPGSGKTTTLWKILSDHALQAKDDTQAPLPLLVRLGSLGSAGLETSLKAALGSLAEYYDDLLKEKRLVFLLDGLNEMTAAYHDANLKEIRKLIEHCRKEKMLAAVTCRELDYTATLDLNLPGRVTIQPLSPPRIQRFVNAYIEEPGKGDELFWQLAGGTEIEKAWHKREQAGASFEEFWAEKKTPDSAYLWALEDTWNMTIWDHRRSLMTLAANPYMLFMITQVFTQAGILPSNRGLLFQTFIDYLLEKRERLYVEQAAQLKIRLSELAYAMQAEGEGTAFTNEQVMVHLRDDSSLYHARSASLLVGEDMIRFSHQLLQEYFAAYSLQNIMAHISASELFPPESWWEPKGWEETLIILAGLYSDDCTPVIDWIQDAQPDVAARCIKESGAYYPPNKLMELRDRWIPRLTDLNHNPSPKARAVVGQALGRLKVKSIPLDNRKGVSIISADGAILPDIDWVEIPAGKFTYQKDYKRIEPVFYIARYPITVAQFQTFLDDPHGFTNPLWWEGLSATKGHRDVPGEQTFKFSNHPRTRVSWHDAVAFCRWLTGKISEYPQLLPDNLAKQTIFNISLPTEWQWEKAAQGIIGFEHSYSRKLEVGKANIQRSAIRKTSTVGIFPQTKSQYGILDLIGNVWEWCLNEYRTPEKIGLYGDVIRAVRGGSWEMDQIHVDASTRTYKYPSGRYDGSGFRVVARLSD